MGSDGVEVEERKGKQLGPRRRLGYLVHGAVWSIEIRQIS
jgi:hypothetical protein